jgi:ubiquinone/menaquinone biosynthesis C-methylase UbiE
MTQQSETPQSRVQTLFSRKSSQYVKSSLLTDRDNLARVRELAGISQDDLVLDVATGTGYMARVAAEAGAKVIATDFTLNMLLETRRELKGWEKSMLALADADILPFANNSFDVVVCRVSIHHFANPQLAIGEMARVCKPGGKVLIMDVVSSENQAKSDLHNKMGKLRDPSEVRQWQLSELQQMMQHVGLTVAKTETWLHVMAFDEWIWLGGADEKTAEELQEMMIDSMEGDKAGLNPEFRDGELVFTWTTGILVASKY